MKVNGWIVFLVIAICIGGVGTYAYKKHGLPIMCYKDNQQETLSPGKGNKLVVYHWNCRKEIFGIDFGPYAWTARGFEIVPIDEKIKRHSFPPNVLLQYKRSARTKENMEIPPYARISWTESTRITVFHKPDSRSSMRFSKGYIFDFIEEPNR